jgi:VCBS repeat-containing protein
MKNILLSIMLLSVIALISSCEKDEGKLPNISFKTGGSYISTDATLAGGSVITIGINSSKAEDKDVLKKFNISQSVNGAAATSAFSKDLSGSEGDNYSYDYTATLGTTSGQTTKYTFTVTNRDGLTNQVSLTVTVQ